jgi:cytochrome c553
MKHITLLSLAAATLLFTGCGEEAKKAAEEATEKTVEVVKDSTSDVQKAASELAESTQEKAKELTDKAVEKGKVLAEKAEAKTAEATEAVKKAISSEEKDDGAALYAKCAGCHGKDGKTKALGKSEILAGQSKDDLEKKIEEYKAGTRDAAGMGTLMKGQVAGMSDEDIEEVSEYISELK